MFFPRRRRAEIAAGLREAERARIESVDALHAAVIDGQEAAEASKDLRRIQHRNHFREIIADAYRGRTA